VAEYGWLRHCPRENCQSRYLRACEPLDRREPNVQLRSREISATAAADNRLHHILNYREGTVGVFKLHVVAYALDAANLPALLLKLRRQGVR